MKKSHESKSKKILTICLAAMLAVLLCACGGGGDESGSTAASSGSAPAEVAVEKQDKESASKNKEAKKEESKKKGIKKEAEQKKSEQEKAEEVRQESGETQNTKSSDKSTAKSETKKESKEKKAPKKKYCHIVIECKKLVGNDDIEPGYEDLVPSTGYILRGVDIEIKDGDTVYDVLKKAGKEYGFIINVDQTQFGAYIAGIAGLDEKICGEESGWKYKVNGSYPGKSCAKVKVSDGDKVVWVYVLKA